MKLGLVRAENRGHVTSTCPRTCPRFSAAAPVAVVAALALLAARFVPFQAIPFWRCAWKSWTGIPCPGCGCTTAFVRLAHGEVGAALAASPLGSLLFAACAAALAVGLARAAGFAVRLDLSPRERAWAGRLLVLGVAANWLYLVTE